MRVAVIGAGAAGLASAKVAMEYGHQADVFEIRSVIGGTWAYTDEVGTDQYGFPIYSAMYKGLRTNLPKEVMGFPDYSIPENDRSYLTQQEILDFLKAYADDHGVTPFIQCQTMVKDIRPVDGKWKVTTVYKPTRQETENIYDSVMICNGHYNNPSYPKIDGQESFKGKIDHSQNYREETKFKDRRVLIIGAGPSGLDITLNISRAAKYVVLSHHLTEPFKTQYPSNVQIKPDVKRIIDSETVEFVDGTCCGFDDIICCTGYNYSFPFLDPSCQISVNNNHITNLYKHMINIEMPTMCFIGVPFNVCAFQMFDLQARFFVKYLTGELELPSKGEMHRHNQRDIETRKTMGYSPRQMHMMGAFQQAYYNDIAADAQTNPIPPVLVKLRDFSVKRLYDDLINFRNDAYRIVDDHNFVKVKAN